MKRNRQIDGLRCIALVMIIAFHYFYRYNQIYNAGNGEIQIFKYFGVFGVNIFLLISAYFMYIPLKTNVDVDLKNYYKKKLLRLWPVYLCSIVMICIVLYIIPLPGRMVSGKDFIYNVFMINGYIGTPYVDGAHWYLTTLVAFYFIQGILLKARKLENIYCLAIWLLLDYYRTRFQLEFCFRDGKQHAGITNCQGADFRKLDFHFNASLAAVNLAKAACKRLGITYSISSCKSFIHNAYMLGRFICVFGINPDMQVIDKLFKELILFTARAA